ncbi:hypothetical protein E2562_024098 [Oryza meyeriana var. granulata]|uniref:Uncharacterized protein n=1 Tax=Oryza meyeriana var. granulata TaxID=110450 RepID=A0A6G1CI18_9ORYZ|nr:hypothetical protein E2562_024098 [Oryza meyeriana var. granulata]
MPASDGTPAGEEAEAGHAGMLFFSLCTGSNLSVKQPGPYLSSPSKLALFSARRTLGCSLLLWCCQPSWPGWVIELSSMYQLMEQQNNHITSHPLRVLYGQLGRCYAYRQKPISDKTCSLVTV